MYKKWSVSPRKVSKTRSLLNRITFAGFFLYKCKRWSWKQVKIMQIILKWMKLVQYSWKSSTKHLAFWEVSFQANKTCIGAYRVWSEQLCSSRICNELRPVPQEELEWQQPQYHHIERQTKFIVNMRFFSNKIRRNIVKTPTHHPCSCSRAFLLKWRTPLFSDIICCNFYPVSFVFGPRPPVYS